MITRRFERDDEAGVRRFWEIELDGIASALAVALAGVVRIGTQIDPAIGRDDGPPGYYAAVGE